ncbi:MAG TPA: shikimate kinase [Flavobacterium sp.]|uniref:shikimate kinase n=1 Tax=Flavobacterium sp. TaxID=239 RepID=UPI002D111057|nr:shikimate kinase [Flavobacterium sp.]HNP32851.1 shikimate kinase [Flavobacterium sp.]
MRKIILVGYMAVGKTTIAQLLAQKMGYKMLDTDKLIEKKTDLSISEIFQQKGEVFFRKIEHEIFKEILQRNENVIISTGGGTPCYANNHLLLNSKNVTSIYLKASVDTIFKRLKSSQKGRPLVAEKTEDELKEFVAKHLFERSYFYNQATFKVDIDAKNKGDIANEIIELLH